MYIAIDARDGDYKFIDFGIVEDIFALSKESTTKWTWSRLKVGDEWVWDFARSEVDVNGGAKAEASSGDGGGTMVLAGRGLFVMDLVILKSSPSIVGEV